MKLVQAAAVLAIYIDCDVENNEKVLKFKVGDHMNVSKYQNFFAKGYVPNWSEGAFVVKKIENTAPWTYVIIILTVKKLLKHFTKKTCKGQIKQNLG